MDIILALLVFIPVVLYIAWPYVRPRSLIGAARRESAAYADQLRETIETDTDTARAEQASQDLRQTVSAFAAAMGRSGGQLGGEGIPLSLAEPAACPQCAHPCEAGNRFCPACGARLIAEGPRESSATLLVEPVADKTKYLLLLCGVLAGSLALAQETAPHANLPTGIIAGHLQLATGAGKSAERLAKTPYRIEVKNSGTVLVSVTKVTDAEGRFEIRNVLPVPTLQYFVTATRAGVTAVSQPLQLPPDTPQLKLDLLLVPDATARPVEADEKPVMPRSLEALQPAAADAMPATVPRANVTGENPGFRPNPVRIINTTWGREQWIGIGLTAIAVLLVLLQIGAARKQRR